MFFPMPLHIPTVATTERIGKTEYPCRLTLPNVKTPTEQFGFKDLNFKHMGHRWTSISCYFSASGVWVRWLFFSLEFKSQTSTWQKYWIIHFRKKKSLMWHWLNSSIIFSVRLNYSCFSWLNLSHFLGANLD